VCVPPLPLPLPLPPPTVLSRVVVLWGIVHISPPSQTSVFFPLMAASWAAVEVPRYLFYIVKENGSPSYGLTWLRYSMFMVLYPTGISGEVGCLWNALDLVRTRGVEIGASVALPNAWNVAYNHYGTLLFLLALYAPGSPFMIGNMWSTRVKALRDFGKPKTA
jgi:very-long-chain (3R)-3-hydroxyacyl-CoA dehydratase